MKCFKLNIKDLYRFVFYTLPSLAKADNYLILIIKNQRYWFKSVLSENTISAGTYNLNVNVNYLLWEIMI